MTNLKLADEVGRLASLRRYDVLDTPAEAPFDKITQLVKTVLNVPIAAVSLIDADRQWFKSCVGLDVRETGRDISFCTHTIQSRQPMVIGNAALDPKFAENELVLGPPYIASYAGAPLITPDGYALGSLCAIDIVPRQFEAWQIDVLTSFAALVVDEFELRRLGQTDHLTGALSRRALLTEAERAMAYFARHDVPSAIISFDIDHFKHSNDAYGHATGDEILRESVALINKQSRPGDMLARLGGDEFALLSTGVSIEQALQTAEHCRVALAGHNFAHDPQLRATASFGVAALEAGHMNAQEWLADADAALHEAKQSGRNRSCVKVAAPLPAETHAPLRDIADMQAESEEYLPEDDEDSEDFEQHRKSVEPLSRGLWAKMQNLRRVKTVTNGRLAYGGLRPGIVNCRILNVTKTGILVEASTRILPPAGVFLRGVLRYLLPGQNVPVGRIRD